jgi:tetratricopeptide (TPR) repeat protein
MKYENNGDLTRCGPGDRWCAIIAAVGLLLASTVDAAAPDLAQAEELLQAGQAAEAVVLYKQALEADPSSVGAHLGLGRAYYALGQYAQARIEFQNVLKYDNLAEDLHGQADVYNQTATDYAAGRPWRSFYYAETGIGNYRENSSSGTDLFGGAGDYDTFLPIRVGGGWNTSLTERHSFNGTLDYRFRTYDESGRRNDSDLRWNVNVSRPVDDDNLRLGLRGRTSYRGEGQYRNDWGVYADYRIGLGATDEVTIGGEVRERRYPSGPLRSRTRDIAELTGSWTHALANGRTSLTLGGQLTQEWATQDRPEGDGSFWGINGGVDHSFHDSLDGFFWWSYVNESYDDERPDFTSDPELLKYRNDDLWNFGGGLVWSFAPGWSLRPTVEYNWEDSSIDALAYSSTELWLAVRKAF